DVIALLHEIEHDRPFDLGRETLAVLGGHDTVELAVHDVDRAGDVAGNALERQRRGLAPRLLERGALAAHAARLAGEIGHAGEGFAPVVGAAERETGLDALVEGGGARCVVAAETDAGDAEARRVDVTPGLDVVDHGFDGDLVVAADREIIFAFALPGPVER